MPQGRLFDSSWKSLEIFLNKQVFQNGLIIPCHVSVFASDADYNEHSQQKWEKLNPLLVMLPGRFL